MNGRQKFLTAFLAGLAAPASLYVPSISYRPLINDLTFAEPFALVGYFLSQAFAAENERLDSQPNRFTTLPRSLANRNRPRNSTDGISPPKSQTVQIPPQIAAQVAAQVAAQLAAQLTQQRPPGATPALRGQFIFPAGMPTAQAQVLQQHLSWQGPYPPPTPPNVTRDFLPERLIAS